MNIKDIVNRDLVNLVNCESEPIHIPGSVQPHGFLLALSKEDLIVRFCSANTAAFCGAEPAAILGKGIGEILDGETLGRLNEYVRNETLKDTAPFLFRVGNSEFSAAVNFAGPFILLEAEPVAAGELEIPDLYDQTGRFLRHMDAAGTLNDLCASVADEVRRVTGYDRVMIYRFDERYNGEVIAESKRTDLESFAKQKYPHTDIPAQARELYIRNKMRMIADVNYAPVPLLTLSDESTNSSLDLSLSSLRSVSPVHIEYLKNMGVGATLTISLLLDGKLWGLVACHHYSPKLLLYHQRLAAMLRGNFLTSQIRVRESAEEFTIAKESEKQLQVLLGLLGNEDNSPEQVFGFQEIEDFCRANGHIVWYRGKLYLFGKTPGELDSAELVSTLVSRFGKRTFSTRRAGVEIGDIAAKTPYSAGLIYYSLSPSGDDCIIWLREEIVETIKWAGNPYENKGGEASSPLTPRKSFELYLEEVRGFSKPWLKSELANAESFSFALGKNLGLRDAQLQELRYRRLNDELTEANKELANINWISTHDLKEPLRKIQMFASMILDREDSNISERDRGFVSRMSASASRMQELINDLLQYAGTSSAEKNFEDVDLNAVLKDCIADLAEEIVEKKLTVHAENLPVVRGVHFQLTQLFTNLISNAIKFSAGNRAALVELTCRRVNGSDETALSRFSSDAYYRIAVKDNGIGFEQENAEKIFDVFQRLKHEKEISGTGIGLAICKKVVENHNGMIAATSEPGQGTEIRILLPVQQ